MRIRNIPKVTKLLGPFQKGRCLKGLNSEKKGPKQQNRDFTVPVRELPYFALFKKRLGPGPEQAA